MTTAEGHRLHWYQIGRGPEVVMIHGLAANSAFWYPAAMRLSREYRFTVIDLRGLGYSDMTPGGYSASSLADDVQSLIEHLNLDRPHLLGHSYGGLVALAHGVKYPTVAATVGVVDTKLRSLSPEESILRGEEWPRIRRFLAKYGVEIDPERDDIGIALLEALANPRLGDARRRLVAAGRYLPFGSKRGSRSAQRWLKLLETTDARREFLLTDSLRPEDLATLEMPVWACYGGESTHLRSLDRLALLPLQLTDHTIPGAGHYSPVTRSDDFAQAYCKFLSQVGKRAFDSMEPVRGFSVPVP